MKLVSSVISGIVLVLILSNCKTPVEPVKANYYNPYFDQTKKIYVKTPNLNEAKLDTTVMIRDVIRDTVVLCFDTISFEEIFYLKHGELMVPLELINEKPPLYDTFLVATAYLINAKFIHSVFLVIKDSILLTFGSDSISNTSDSLEKIDNTSLAKAKVNDKLVNKPAVAVVNKQQSKKQQSNFFSRLMGSVFSKNSKRDKKEVVRNTKPQNTKTNNRVDNFSDKKNSRLIAENPKSVKPAKKFYTISEILGDTIRNLIKADSVLSDLLSQAPWLIGDSIPYFEGMSNYFLDSTLVLMLDTVYVEIIDSSKIVPQLPFNELTEEYVDTLLVPDRFIYNEEVVFRIFYPEDEAVYVEMVRVNGGTFKIGSNYFDEDERPEYKLTVSSFLLSKFEITNGLFCNFLNDLVCDSLGEIAGHKVIELYHPATKIKQNRFSHKFAPIEGYEDFPVVNVTWVGAQMFCKAVGGRLPSEAEWEYAAKGGIYAKRYYTDLKQENYDYEYRYAGGNYMPDLGWIVDNSGGQLRNGGRKKPNELGLYDMCGNVWEWCYDQYNKEFYSRNGDSSDPMCLSGGTIRVNRGGCWSSDAMYCRITNRNFANQYSGNPYLGFRLMKFP